MFCRSCGASMPDKATVCPVCHAVDEGAGTVKTEKGEKAPLFHAPTKNGKSYAAVFTALTLLPAIFILTVDFVWNLKFDWAATGYLVGALLVVWVCGVLPALHVTPAPVTAGICFLSVTLYVLYIVKQVAGSMEWFTVFALPLILILAVFIGLDSALTNALDLNKMTMLAVICGEGSLFSIAWGLLWVNYHGMGTLQPRVSVVFAAMFLSAAVLCAAAGYVAKIRKK